MTIEELRARLTELNGRARAIEATAEKENRDLSTEETVELDQLLSAFERTKADIERRQKLGEQTELLHLPQGRKTEADIPAKTDGDGEGNVAIAKTHKLSNPSPHFYSPSPKNWGYKNLGEFAQDVYKASGKQGNISRTLSVAQSLAATTYGNEAAGADGGFAVPPDFRAAIMEKVMGEESLLSRCDIITVSGNSLTVPADETTPWATSGGIQAYWENEGATGTQSKPSLEQKNIRLNKVRALVPVTEEILEDAPAMDAYLRVRAPAKIGFKVNLAIIQGTGVGQPLGLLGAPALVSVAKETSQTADTLVGNNVIKMFSRMPAANRQNAVWLINQDIEPQLYKLAVPGTDNAGNAVTGWGSLVYMPAGGLSSSPYGTLFGRPVLPTQACETLGDKGDIFFVDLSQYLAIVKSGPNPRVETSMHLWFDQDMMAFKFVLRVGGMPWWATTIAARDGSNTYSPYVTLDERA